MTEDSRSPVRVGDVTVEEVERRVLAFLCGSESEVEFCAQISVLLARYRFGLISHQVMFDCLKSCPPARPDLLREQLPALLVRAGFPDFDLTPYFGGPAMTGGEALALCQDLLIQEG